MPLAPIPRLPLSVERLPARLRRVGDKLHAVVVAVDEIAIWRFTWRAKAIKVSMYCIQQCAHAAFASDGALLPRIDGGEWGGNVRLGSDDKATNRG